MEEIFKRESYLKDIFCFIALSLLLAISYYSLPYYFPRYILASSALMFLMLAIHIGIWMSVAISYLNIYNTSLIINNGGITVKYPKGGWSCSWSEIDEWQSTVDIDGEKEIKLKIGGLERRLPDSIIDDKNHRRHIKSIIRDHCGDSVRVDGWTISDDTDG